MVVSNVSQNGGVGDDLFPDLTAVKLDPRQFDGDYMKLGAKIWNAVISGLSAARGSDGKPIVTGTWSDGAPSGCRQILFSEEDSQLTWDPIDGYVMDGVFIPKNDNEYLELIAEIDRGGVVLQLAFTHVAFGPDANWEELDYGHWLLKPSESHGSFDCKLSEVVDRIVEFLD